MGWIGGVTYGYVWEGGNLGNCHVHHLLHTDGVNLTEGNLGSSPYIPKTLEAKSKSLIRVPSWYLSLSR